MTTPADSRRFRLVRTTDVTGVSGTGHVADGVAFPDGTVALRWRSEWPTSVVFHDRGIEAVQAVHGHGGATKIVWLDVPEPWESGPDWADLWNELDGYVYAASRGPRPDDAALIRAFMRELKARRTAPVKEWMAGLTADVATSEAPAIDPEMLREMASRLLTAANEAEAAK